MKIYMSEFPDLQDLQEPNPFDELLREQTAEDKQKKSKKNKITTAVLVQKNEFEMNLEASSSSSSGGCSGTIVEASEGQKIVGDPPATENDNGNAPDPPEKSYAPGENY